MKNGVTVLFDISSNTTDIKQTIHHVIIKMQSVAIIFFSGKYPIVNFIEMLPSPLPETNVKEILSIIERSVCNIIWSMPICLILFALIAAK